MEPRWPLWVKLFFFFFIWAVLGGTATLWAGFAGGSHPSETDLRITRCVAVVVFLVGVIGPFVIGAAHRSARDEESL